MTWSGLILVVLLVLIAAWFWYAYTNRKVDSGLVVRMWKARMNGRDRLRSVIKKRPPKTSVSAVSPVGQRRTPARPAWLRPTALMAETGTIGDVDGPDLSTADLRSKRLPSPQTLAFLEQGPQVTHDQPGRGLAGDDTGGVAEAHLQAAYASPAYDPQESVTNVLPQQTYDSYVEADGDMKHDQPAVGAVDDSFPADSPQEK